MESFTIDNSLNLSTIVTKLSILDVYGSPQSAIVPYFCSKCTIFFPYELKYSRMNQVEYVEDSL